MINTNMRTYNYFTFGERDSYGQPKLSDTVQGSINMAIYTTGQSVQDNVLYLNAQYMGLTFDKNINDKYVIDYNGEKLKVLYIASNSRFKQVFMSRLG